MQPPKACKAMHRLVIPVDILLCAAALATSASIAATVWVAAKNKNGTQAQKKSISVKTGGFFILSKYHQQGIDVVLFHDSFTEKVWAQH